MEIGPLKDGPMGRVALEWVDLAAYASLTGPVEPWEARLLLAMSRAYARGQHEGKSAFSIAPADRH